MTRIFNGAKMGIARKLWLGFGAVVVLVCAVLLVVSTQLTYVETAHRSVVDHANPLSAAAYEMEINTVEAGLAVMSYAKSVSPEHTNRFTEDNAEFDDWSKKFIALTHELGQDNLGRKTVVEHERFVALGQAVFNAKNREHEAAKNFVGLLTKFHQLKQEVAPLDVPISGAVVLDQAARNTMQSVGNHLNEMALFLFSHIEIGDESAIAEIEHNIEQARLAVARLRQLLHGTKSAAWAAEVSQQFHFLARAILTTVEGRRDLQEAVARFIAQRKVMDDLLDEKIQSLSESLAMRASDSATSELRSMFVGLALAALAVALGALGYVRHLSRLFIVPVTELSAGAARLMTDDRQPTPLTVRSHDELGELTRTFNAAAAHLWQSRQDLAASNERLENQVTARTLELSAAFTQLEGELAASKIVERDLERAMNEAQAANKAKSSLLANMSHELRTPLNAIIGFSEMIALQSLGPDAKIQYRDYAKDVHQSGLHLLSLINDVLDMAKIEAGHMEIYLEATDPMDIVGPCRRLLIQQAELAGVELSLAAIPKGPIAVQADPKRLKQVVLNLLSNAVKFTPKGGTVTIAVTRVDDQIEISVADTGIGMSTTNIDAALQPFRQIDSEIARKHEGTGLGLPISKRLTEMQGGTLVIESTPGQGTTARVRLPAATANAPALPVLRAAG